MTACSYTSTRSPSPTRQLRADVPLDRNLSMQLALHLNDAATTHDDPDLCARMPNFSLLLARDDEGATFPAVTLTPGCQQIQASNDTTSRYIDVSDTALQRAIETVEAAFKHK